MRHADHSAFKDAIDLIDQALELFWINIEAPCDDEVFPSPDDTNVAIGIDLTQVPCNKPTIGAQLFCCFFRHLPIAFEDIGSAHFDRSDFTLFDFAFGVHNPKLHTGKRHTDCSSTALAVIRV